MLKKIAASIFFTTVLISAACAQSVQQSGNVTRGHIPYWVTSGVIADGGSSASSPITSIGVTNNGGAGICISSDAITNPRNQLCFGASTNGPAVISLQNYGTAAPQSLQYVINGVVSVPGFVPVGGVAGNIASFGSGNTLQDTGVSASSGTITSGSWAGTNIPISFGGTGASSAASARSNLGLGTIATQNASGVAITGGTITGLPTPVNPADAAIKSYVDSVATGLNILAQSRLATAAVLPNSPTYNNGSSGVGATLTAGSNTTLTVDSVTANLNDIILVKNQTSAFQNGIYTVTAAGSGAAPWVLTRATYFNIASQMKIGSYTLITSGLTNGSTSWTLASTVVTVGTDSLTFNQFSSSGGGVTSLNGQQGTVNVVAGTGIGVAASGGNITITNNGNTRTLLTNAATFHISLASGNDSNTCLNGNPGRSFNYCYQLVQANYDTGGHSVTFLSDDTTSSYPDCLLFSGPLFGQAPGNWGLTIVDANGSTFGGPTAHAGAGGCSNSNPYLVGANFGAAFYLQNAKLNNTGSWNVGTNLFDMVNIGAGSNIGVDHTDTIGSNQGQGADFDVNGILTILSGYTMNKPAYATTGTWSSGGSSITVASATNLQVGMGISTAIGPSNCFIDNISGTTIHASGDVNGNGTSCVFTTNGSGTSITFTAGAVAHWDVGAGGQIQCANNNLPNLIVIPSIGGTPFYFQGFATANIALSQINCGGVWFQFGTTGPMFNINGGSNIYTAGAGVGYFPGNFDNSHGVNITAGSTTAALGSAPTQYDVVGAEITDYLQATGCATVNGSGALTGCTNAVNCTPGAIIVNTANIPNGSTVASVSGSTISLVTGQAARATGTTTVTCTGHYLANGTLIQNISGTTVTLDRPALNSATGMPVGIGGLVLQQGHGGNIF